MGLIKMYAAAISYLVNGPGTTEKAEGYVARPVRYSTIDVNDLADHIAADSRIERSKIAVITDSLIKQITEMVLNGHAISVPHLGTFSPKIKSKLAPTENLIDATSFVAKVNFRPSVELKRDLQSTRIEKITPATPFVPLTPSEEAANLAPYFDRLAVQLGKEKFPEAKSIQVSGTPLAATIQIFSPLVGDNIDVVGHILKVDYTDNQDVDHDEETVGIVVFKAKNSGTKYNAYSYAGARYKYLANDKLRGAYFEDDDTLEIKYIKIEHALAPV